MSFFKLLLQKVKAALTNEILCDTCMYDYGNACIREDRPNAQVCPDYKRKH